MNLLALEEPVRRYLDHATGGEGADAWEASHLRMRGEIRLGRWLSFTAEQDCDGRSFRWRARAAHGLAAVEDAFADGHGAMRVRLLGQLPELVFEGEHVSRSAAGRAALESIWCPGALLPREGVEWRAIAEDEIAVTLDIAPERPTVHLRLAPDGGLRSVSALRWGPTGHGRHGYLACGAIVLAERTFGAVTVPSRVTVGWQFGTPAFAPFFRAEVTALTR